MAIIIRAPRATERKLYVFAVILQGTVSQDCCDSNSKKYLCSMLGRIDFQLFRKL